jgi:hypothetical protein
MLLTASSATAMIISEFRLQGPTPGATTNEFVELYNESSQPLTVSTSDGSPGWALAASNGVARFVVPNGTVIPPGGHYLGVNSTGYGLAGYATGDATFTTDIPLNAGIALFRTANAANFTLANRLDAVGSTTEANTIYKEGTGYGALSNFNIDDALYRNLLTGAPQDTGNNATDFLFVDTNGTLAGFGQRLGAPGPQNLGSPILGPGNVAVSLLDPAQGPAAAPNVVRDLTSDPVNNSSSGTISIRRLLTNNSGAAITRLDFRVVDLTTFPSPGGTADLRPRTSTDVTVGSTLVRGTTLEQPPSQVNGGGFNSSLRVPSVSPATPLAPGSTIAVQVLIGIQSPGPYRFCADIEGTPTAGGTLSVVGATDGGPLATQQCTLLPTLPPPLSPPVATPGDTAAPVLSELALSPKAFAVSSGKGASASAKRKTGTTIHFDLSEAAGTEFTVSRLATRKAGKKAHHSAKPKKVKVGTFTAAGKLGKNSVPFSGKLRAHGKPRALKPGRYSLTATATDAAGNVGKTASAGFTVLP